MIGEQIKDFVLTTRLGRGGMGEVWAAEQQLIKTKVAIKLLLAEISTDTHHVQRFFNEAIAVSKIRHAGTVKIFDVGFHHGRAYLIMEFLEGESLASRIARSGRLSIGQIADTGKQIASILEATHAVGITHRDLKPDNIFLVPDAELASRERVRVLDFGIAKLHSSTGATGITATGGTMGTPAYMAPEQWKDAAKADARADIYAMGCFVFEMCCGRPPFVVGSIGEACSKHLGETPPRIRTVATDTPAELDDLVARMLAKQADDRPTMREINAVFARLAAAHPPSGTTFPEAGARARGPDTTLGSAAAARERRPHGSRTALLAIGATVVVGAAVTAVVALSSRGDRTRRDAVEPTRPPPPTPDAPAPAAPKATSIANEWIAIQPPDVTYALGIDDKSPADRIGFRWARKIMSPAQAYAIQQHEVTWSELDPWLAEHQLSIEYPAWALEPKARASLPATAITWSVANDYCRSRGGALPTEEQWEYAVRGAARRANPWGDEPLDRMLTHAYAGPDAVPAPVMSHLQDQTPQHVYDLAGNVQEWTAGLWREDRPARDESFVQAGQTSIRAIRGLPLALAPPRSVPSDSAAYRERLCATGPCVLKGKKLRDYVGFRCVK